ncbi:MAG: serine/threonine-protein kinase [Kofleriaceae bacterium]
MSNEVAQVKGARSSAPEQGGADLRAGVQIGNYIVQHRLGSGGQGDVFLARDVVLGRLVELKVVRRRRGSTPDTRGLEEARLIATLDHPNIVRIYHVELADGVWFVAMEYVDGGNLEHWVARLGPLRPVPALRFALAAADALQHAHHIGVMHRDVNPQNLLVSRSEVLKLADFGLATFIEGMPAGSGQLLGTPRFMPPEIWAGDAATAQSDVYCMGGSLLFMLTGEAPFPGTTVEALRKAHLGAEPKISSEVPAVVTQLIQHCLAKRPSARPASAKALHEEIIHAISVLTGDRRKRSGSRTGPAPEEATETVAGYTHRSRVAADDAVLELPAFATAKAAVERSMQGGPPLVVAHGSQPELLWRVVRSVVDSSVGRYYLAARCLLKTPSPALMAVLAEKFHLGALPSDARYDAIVTELTPDARVSSPIPGLLQIEVLRGLSRDEMGDLLELARHIGPKGCKLLVLCDDGVAESLAAEAEFGCYSSLLNSIGLRQMSARETAHYIQRWTATATAERIRWTDDALRLAIHLDAANRNTIDKLIHNAIMIRHVNGIALVTTWCVLGAAAHVKYVQTVDDVAPRWRTRPSSWPDDSTLAQLCGLRVEWASLTPGEMEGAPIGLV